ncbi:MAG TPA: O-methyltransferase [Candidatus Micrarchaeia archaeon]|nr:O-methyltransferase [Candidatus Micrarchaeia archaeon]
MGAFDAVDLDYLAHLHPDPGPVLRRLDAESRAEGIPSVEPPTGPLLATLTAAVGARTVLEVGTAIGYSGLWMARGLAPGGRITTIDPDAGRQARARAAFAEAGCAEVLDCRHGRALDVLPTLSGPFDVAFLDALKEELEAYLDHAVKLVRPGGLVLVDNLLWSGEAARGAPADAAPERRRATAAVQAFNRTFLGHPLLLATIVPVGDGVGIGVVRGAASG